MNFDQFERLIKLCGKGPAFLALGALEVCLGTFAISRNPEAATGLIGMLTAVNMAIYPTGAYKAHMEAKYSKDSPTIPTPPKEGT